MISMRGEEVQGVPVPKCLAMGVSLRWAMSARYPEGAFCLAHVLFVALAACEEVYQIGGLTSGQTGLLWFAVSVVGE